MELPPAQLIHLRVCPHQLATSRVQAREKASLALLGLLILQFVTAVELLLLYCCTVLYVLCAILDRFDRNQQQEGQKK